MVWSNPYGGGSEMDNGQRGLQTPVTEVGVNSPGGGEGGEGW